MSDQETYAQVRREAIESGLGREMWDTAMRWHTEMVLDDLREWGQHRYVNTLEAHLDAYEKDNLK